MGIRGAVGFILPFFALNFGDDGFEFLRTMVLNLGTMGLIFGDDGLEFWGRWV